MEQNLLGYYYAIEESSRKMLEAAKAEDWDAVVSCEGSCAVLIEQLRSLGRNTDLDQVSRKEKSNIMLRILQNDAQIRYLVEPWLAHCEKNLHPRYLLH
jgi:flagellar protein FliT